MDEGNRKDENLEVENLVDPSAKVVWKFVSQPDETIPTLSIPTNGLNEFVEVSDQLNE